MLVTSARADLVRAARSGTANKEARDTVEAVLLDLLDCRRVLAEMKAQIAGLAIDAIVLERLVAVCAMALGSIMSGMGDLKTFKLLRCALCPLRASFVPLASPLGASFVPFACPSLHLSLWQGPLGRCLSRFPPGSPGSSTNRGSVRCHRAICASRCSRRNTLMLEALRARPRPQPCRALRKRLNVTEATSHAPGAAAINRSYGVHMALGISIGFLFLGGSCCKFSTSNSAIAMLLLSMWPALPSGPNDNRSHLQVCNLPR